jgi:hypothetical protein
MTEPLLRRRRSNRYVVMPCRTEISNGIHRRWFGILDTMLTDRNLNGDPAWCSLPDTGRLEWEDFNEAMRWLNRCRAQRELDGGPAWYLPEGWYGPGIQRRADARSAADPWAALPADSPLVHA